MKSNLLLLAELDRRYSLPHTTSPPLESVHPTKQRPQPILAKPTPIPPPRMNNNIPAHTHELLQLLLRAPIRRQRHHADEMRAHANRDTIRQFLILQTIERSQQPIHHPQPRRDAFDEPQQIQLGGHLADVEVPVAQVRDFPVHDVDRAFALRGEGFVGEDDASRVG